MIMTVACAEKKIMLGRVGENEARVVKFNVATIRAEFPGATFTVLNKRPGDAAAYPVNSQYVTQEGDSLLWTIQSGDVTVPGTGECEIRAEENGKVVKTVIYMTMTGRALDGSANPPEPWESWVQQVEDDADRAEAAAELLEHPGAEAETLEPGASATASYADGTFSFGIPRGADGQDGQDGYSPTANVSKSGSTATITITDKNGTTTAQISDGEDGQDGQDGVTPEISIGTVTKGTDPAASMDNTDPAHPVLSLTLPKGDKGEQGDDYVLTTADKEEIAGLVQEMTVVPVSGTTPSISGVANCKYLCGEVSTISITPPSNGGIIDVIFQSGTTPAVLTVPNTVTFQDWFDPTSLEASKTYEINIADGYGVVTIYG